MSPAQLVRAARNHNKLKLADQRHDIAMAWVTAAWHRAKKMPTLKRALEATQKKSRMSLDDVVAKINSVQKVDE